MRHVMIPTIYFMMYLSYFVISFYIGHGLFPDYMRCSWYYCSIWLMVRWMHFLHDCTFSFYTLIWSYMMYACLYLHDGCFIYMIMKWIMMDLYMMFIMFMNDANGLYTLWWICIGLRTMLCMTWDAYWYYFLFIYTCMTSFIYNSKWCEMNEMWYNAMIMWTAILY